MFGTLSKVQEIVDELKQECVIERKKGQKIANQLLGRQAYPDNTIETLNEQGQQCILNDTMSAPIDAANHLYNINYGHEIKSNRPIIGKAIVLFRRLIRKTLFYLLNPIIEDQNRFNVAVTQSLNEIHNNVISLIAQANENRANIGNLYSRIDLCENGIEEISKQLKETKSGLEETKNGLEENKSGLEETKNGLEETKSGLEETKSGLDSLIEEYQREMSWLKEKISIVEDAQMLLSVRIKKNNSNNAEIKVPFLSGKKSKDKSSTTYQEIDYFSFENAFRGAQDKIKEAQEIYIEYYKGKDNILDMGCGRGEFLELLKDNEINAIGVDLYDDFVELCKEKGLSAVCGDAIEYLASQEKESLGGIFGAQLIEHLKPEQILEICTLAYDKLQSGGCIILETPNPKCLSIYTNAFYIDPSHVKPVHPETMKYFLKQAGFRDIQILYTDSSKVPYKLPLLDSENVSNLEEFNSGINLLSELIFGSQDYAIIAKK